MTAVVAAGRRILPRGWRDFGVQIVLWLGFYISYLAVRSVVDRDPSKAIVNGFRVIDFEQRFTSHFFEQTAQRVVDSSQLLLTAAAWTYWNSEFTVIGLALLWVYLRRHEWFARFRNTILLTNMIGLVGYVLMPTAPPRFFPELGFVDTIAYYVNVKHDSGLVALFFNPYAAVPSMHVAFALLISIPTMLIVKNRAAKVLWALYPLVITFVVLVTGNHWFFDALAGAAVAGTAALVARHVLSRVWPAAWSWSGEPRGAPA